MKTLTRAELNYQSRMTNVAHTTLNPYGPGVVRIHMVPPKPTDDGAPSVIILSGQDIIPINFAWAVLLNEFIEQVNHYDGHELTEKELKRVVDATVKATRKVYPRTSRAKMRRDLWTIVDALCDIAYGRQPSVDIGYVSLGEYAQHMKAPHRMDLMVSAMTKNGVWHCNQKCLHCYAAEQELSEVSELSTEQWKQILDLCREAGIPQVTFTGGEPTMRPDIVQLVEYAKWFVTRMNTNGVLLTPELCHDLRVANLDSIQITLYSCDAETHNRLVGAQNFAKTWQGIKNAVNAGLSVSINTPLCTLNRDYVATLTALKKIGVEYVTCSGLIVTGNARKEDSKHTQLQEDELLEILSEATRFCAEQHMEISFTSPGWVAEEHLQRLGLNVPTCGASLSNMAVAPDGQVIPCQSWLKSGSGLGNLLEVPWTEIWEAESCRAIREFSSRMTKTCPLRTI